jgi:hypothetical protein
MLYEQQGNNDAQKTQDIGPRFFEARIDVIAASYTVALRAMTALQPILFADALLPLAKGMLHR